MIAASMGSPFGVWEPPLWFAIGILTVFGLGIFVGYGIWFSGRLRSVDWRTSWPKRLGPITLGLLITATTPVFVGITNGTCGLMIAMQHDTMVTCALAVTRLDWIIPALVGATVMVALLPKKTPSAS